MKLGILVSALGLAFAGTLPIAGNEYVLKPDVFAAPRLAQPDLDSLTVISADPSQDRFTRTRLSQGELRLLRGLRSPRGDGGGAAVENLQIWQRNFVESNCPFELEGEPVNVILLLWDAPSSNLLGTDIIMDDAILGNVPDDEVNVGGNMRALQMDSVAPGLHTFGIEDPDTGTSETIEFEVLDVAPMADPQKLRLESGPNCTPSVSYHNVCPVPDGYDVLVSNAAGEGALVENVPSTFYGLVFPEFPPSDYTVEAFGFMMYNDNPNALYRCCPLTSEPVAFECLADECAPPPAGVLVQQGGYAGESDNSLLVSWITDEQFEGGTNVLVNGTSLGVVDTTGFPTGSLVGIELVAPPGPVTIGIQGVCADAQTSAPSQLTFEVLGESPHSTPFAGDIFCSHDTDDAQTVARWENGACSSFYELYFLPNPDTNPQGDFVRRVRGNDVETRVEDTTPGELTVELQGYVWVNGDLHSAVRQRCTPERPQPDQFIRGVCNSGVDEVKPQLSNAVFILKALFQGGQEPSCKEACDMNDDSLLNITDGVFLLRFLFSGTEAPPGFVNNAPACSDIEEGMDCARPNEACPI